MRLQKILVVDDSMAIHDLLRCHLHDEVVEMHSAYDGESAIRFAVQLRPDLVLLDVDLPGLDGFTVCQRLREEVQTRNLPIIFLTAAATVDQKVCGFELGANDYITKPFERAELLARVRAALRVKSRMDFLANTRVGEFMGQLRAVPTSVEAKG
jgi:DNA-binding response OmpR family regulator